MRDVMDMSTWTDITSLRPDQRERVFQTQIQNEETGQWWPMSEHRSLFRALLAIGERNRTEPGRRHRILRLRAETEMVLDDSALADISMLTEDDL
jgi:hypothetical protein